MFWLLAKELRPDKCQDTQNFSQSCDKKSIPKMNNEEFSIKDTINARNCSQSLWIGTLMIDNWSAKSSLLTKGKSYFQKGLMNRNIFNFYTGWRQMNNLVLFLHECRMTKTFKWITQTEFPSQMNKIAECNAHFCIRLFYSILLSITK